MSTLHVFEAICRLITALWNASVVLLQVVRSVVHEAKQEAAEWMALVDDGAPMVTSTSLLYDAGSPASPWPMLIVVRASSFVLLLRLSKHRVLHLEVDETFVLAKLEVIQTELRLHVEHVPRLLQVPIGMHDTRLVRYTPMKLPYLCKEERDQIVPALSASAGGQGRSHRIKCVQLLKEGALRRRLRMDRLGRADGAPKRAKAQVESGVKRRALADATNHGGEGVESGVVDKQARAERHQTLSENASVRRRVESRASAGLRRRGQFDLYAPGTSEFSWLPKC